MDLEKLTDEEIKVLREEINDEFDKRFNFHIQEQEDEFDYTHR